jgi:hypothetical protein
MKNIKVIYIAGVGRSGSTILDRILGTLEGVSSFNEIYRIWLEGFQHNFHCSCGQRFKECSFWMSVAAEGMNEQLDIEKILMLQHSVDHSRHFLKLFTGIYDSDFEKKLTEHREWLQKLYFALAKTSGNQIIVDSSKVPSRALILSGIQGIEVHVIHVVRDLRAVVHAWQKEKYIPETGGALPQFSPVRAILAWKMRNIFCELLASKLPYTRILYEDFARNPRTVLQQLVDRLEPTAGQTLSFVNENSIHLRPIHTIAGNPQRFSSGVTKVRLDSNWKSQLEPRTRNLATFLAYPLLSRYGYLKKDAPVDLVPVP